MNRRILRILCILEQLNTVHSVKLSFGQLLNGMHESSFEDETKESLEGLLEDLTTQGLTTVHTDELDATVKRWGRTEAARVMLVKKGRA